MFCKRTDRTFCSMTLVVMTLSHFYFYCSKVIYLGNIFIKAVLKSKFPNFWQIFSKSLIIVKAWNFKVFLYFIVEDRKAFYFKPGFRNKNWQSGHLESNSGHFSYLNPYILIHFRCHIWSYSMQLVVTLRDRLREMEAQGKMIIWGPSSNKQYLKI